MAGLRDVVNLGWKLAWVVKDQAAPALLDSYDRERRPHAKKMIGLAKLMGRLVPLLRRQLEKLEIKPPNRFRQGFLISGCGRKGASRGALLPQRLVRHDGHIRPSDDVLGDHLT